MGKKYFTPVIQSARQRFMDGEETQHIADSIGAGYGTVYAWVTGVNHATIPNLDGSPYVAPKPKEIGPRPRFDEELEVWVRWCSMGNHWLPMNDENFFPDNRGGYFQGCKPCRMKDQQRLRETREPGYDNRKSRETYARYPERYKKKAREYARKNPDKVNALKRRWNKANPGKSTALHKDWRRANPDMVQAGRDTRQARIVENGGWTTPSEMRLIEEWHDDHCILCGEEVGLENLQDEHLLAVANGGTSFPWNIALACGPCNRAKKARPLHQWLDSYFSPEDAQDAKDRIEQLFQDLWT